MMISRGVFTSTLLVVTAWNFSVAVEIASHEPLVFVVLYIYIYIYIYMRVCFMFRQPNE